MPACGASGVIGNTFTGERIISKDIAARTWRLGEQDPGSANSCLKGEEVELFLLSRLPHGVVVHHGPFIANAAPAPSAAHGRAFERAADDLRTSQSQLARGPSSSAKRWRGACCASE